MPLEQDVDDDYRYKTRPMLEKHDAIGALQIVTARSNGRMFGYLMSVVGPSLDAVDRTEALHLPFFASKDCPPGLGMKLQRFALDELRARGVDEVFGRARNRLEILYRRLGFEDFGTMHRLALTH